MQEIQKKIPDRTAQVPIGSGFGFRSTTSDVIAGVDLSGKIAIVTGGYSGIGLETVRSLSAAGATVIVPARNLAKAKENLQGIDRIEINPLDLMDPQSVDAFADRFLRSGRPLDLLVNSAGVMAPPLSRDGRGYESQFSGNYLGHFQLAARLWPALKKAGRARVVVVSSHGHRLGGVNFEDPNFEVRPYEKWSGYAQSKTAGILFAMNLDRQAAVYGVRAFSLHPGSIATDLLRHMSPTDLVDIGARDKEGNKPADYDQRHKTAEQGAATIVWCATSPQLEGKGGVYCIDCDVAEAISFDERKKDGVVAWARDEASADKLWKLSERLTGVQFQVA